jgi:hypothetical protein
MRKKVTSVSAAPEEGYEIKKGINDLLGAIKKRERPDWFPVFQTIDGVTYTLKFRYPTSTADMSDWERKQYEFYTRIKGLIQTRDCPAAFRDVLDELGPHFQDEDICTAFGIHYWSHPDDKIDEGQALRMVAADPVMSSGILSRIDQEINQGVIVLSMGGVKEAKKNSQTTSDTDSKSKQA